MDPIVLTYLGQTGFLLAYRDTRVVTDPYLSDYVDRHASEPEKWKRLYPPPCALADLKPDAVLISHAHADHLDPWTIGPYAQSGGEALICAPAPEAYRLSDLGVKNIHPAEAEKRFSVRDVSVLPLPCAHTELHQDAKGRYRELSYLISCGRIKVFFGGDMSLYDGLTERVASEGCDIALLPVNGRTYYRTAKNIIGNINCVEAAEFAQRIGAKIMIPMHHDLYAENGCRVSWVIDACLDAGVRALPLNPGERFVCPEADV